MRPENTDPVSRKAQHKVSAVRSVVFFALLQVATGGCFVALSFIPDLPGWLSVLFVLLAVFSVLLLIPAGLVLRQRFQEIEGGELDEAGKY